MKKMGRCVIFSWIIAVVLVTGLLVFLEQLQRTKVHAQSTDNTDGVYTVEGKLWHATLDQPSMGNSALAGPVKIIKDGGSVILQMEFQSLSSGVLDGYLYSLHYFPSWNSEIKVPDGEEPVPATVTEYYEGIYDDYNHPSKGLDKDIRGMFYPHYAVMPVQWNAALVWVQVYVPVMEAVSEGSGKQYARLLLDWNTLKKTDEKVEDISVSPADNPPGGADVPVATAVPDKTAPPETGDSSTANNPAENSGTKNKKLKIGSLEDGTYTVTGEMVKPDKKTESMSNKAVSHNITLTVKNGKYSLEMSLSGMSSGSFQGYLSKLKYFKSGYKKDENGVPSGKKADVTIKTYQCDSSGRKVSDIYGTDYPAKVTFPMIPEAKKDGFVPLQVFVPVMEATSAGTGTQPVYLKLDLSSIIAGKKSQKSSSKADTSTKKNSSGLNKKQTRTSTAVVENDGSGTKKAEKGTVYSCGIVPCYKHPVTGTVEDSGGTSSYATGQGMIESVLGKSGMLEKTENGKFYLTMRMSLMDMTSAHEFQVQKTGQSGWSKVSAVVTQNGSDKNGKTSDFCISIPGKDSIVKISMYVELMGRPVVFYAYLQNIKKGQPGDMKATKVSNDIVNTGQPDGETDGNYVQVVSGTGISIGSAQGLSLSTEGEETSAGTGPDSTAYGTEKYASGITDSNGVMSLGKWIFVLAFSITISGFLLMAAGAVTVYYFRRNWRRWGEDMVDDED